MVSASAGICRNMLASMATSSAIMPTNRNLPMKLKSRFTVVATAPLAKKMMPVSAGAETTTAACGVWWRREKKLFFCVLLLFPPSIEAGHQQQERDAEAVVAVG